MRICFFGHRDILVTCELKEELTKILKERVCDDCEFLFGGYGAFDNLAYTCVSEIDFAYKIKKTYVTPYITESYLKNNVEYYRYKYDEVIYPEIENAPYRFAIFARNKWMIDHSDLIICYLDRPYGGAYNSIKRSINRVKILNLGKLKLY